MTVDFALLAGSAEAVRQASLDRFEALQTREGACHTSGEVRVWTSADTAVETLPGLLLAGEVALDNRDTLCAVLGLSAETPEIQALSDLALACRLVAQEGCEALTQLSGRFALMLWEDQAQCLTVIRDHYGLQPVYLSEDAGQLLVASDLKLLAHLRATPLVPRADSVFRFMTGSSDEGTETAWEGLNRLPSATQLRWTPKQASTEETYWKQEMPPLGPLQDAVSGLRDHLRRAVQVRMDAGLGYMLSGGLDSSTLVTLAAEKQEALPLSTLSFVYLETDAYDESAFIAAVNTKIDAQAHRIQIDGPPKPEDLAPMLEEQFDLCFAPGLMKSRKIYAHAKELGLTALMDGHGGDEVISHGYLHQAELAARGAYWQLWRQMRGAARIYDHPVLPAYLAHLYHYAPWKPRSLLRRGVGWIGRRIETKATQSIDTVTLLRESYRADYKGQGHRETAHTVYGPEDGKPDERRSHLHNIANTMMTRSFEIMHRSASAQGVQPVYPFFDRALVDHCLSVPPAAKLRDGWSRWYLRAAMQGILPEKIQWRPDKADFNEEVARFVVSYLDDPVRWASVETELSEMISAETLRKCFETVRSGSGEGRSALVQILWRSIYLAAWKTRLDHWNSCQKEGTLW